MPVSYKRKNNMKKSKSSKGSKRVKTRKSTKTKKRLTRKSKKGSDVRKMRGGGNNSLNISDSRISSCNLLKRDDQKNSLHIHFGISTTILDNVQSRPSSNSNEKDLYFGKTNTKLKLKNTLINFKKINEIVCFFRGSLRNYIQIYDLNNTKTNTKSLILYFPTGIPVKSDDHYSNIYSENNTSNDSKPVRISFYIENKGVLILLIKFIIPYLTNDTYSKIILSGHSNGMSAATMFSYILYILTLTEDNISNLPKHQFASNFITNTYKGTLALNKLYNFIDIQSNIKDKIYICGTAGFPCLFTNRDEFDKFNIFYNHKYIHVISGLNYNQHQIYDQIACVESPYKNFGSIIFNINMNNKKINCFYLDSILDNEQFSKFIVYDKTKSDIHAFNFYRYLYNKYFDRKTKNDIYFNTYTNYMNNQTFGFRNLNTNYNIEPLPANE